MDNSRIYESVYRFCEILWEQASCAARLHNLPPCAKL